MRLDFRAVGCVLSALRRPCLDTVLTPPASSITCPNSQICATNTYYGIHGCCDPSSLSACTIATSCVPFSAMSTSCTDDLCSKDNAIAKCTASTAPDCYKYLFVYSTGTMSQQGCTSSATSSLHSTDPATCRILPKLFQEAGSSIYMWDLSTDLRTASFWDTDHFRNESSSFPRRSWG
jgi:hypothetical protein